MSVFKVKKREKSGENEAKSTLINAKTMKNALNFG